MTQEKGMIRRQVLQIIRNYVASRAEEEEICVTQIIGEIVDTLSTCIAIAAQGDLSMEQIEEFFSCFKEDVKKECEIVKEKLIEIKKLREKLEPREGNI